MVLVSECVFFPEPPSSSGAGGLNRSPKLLFSGFFRNSIADFVLRFFELSVANHAVLRLPIVAGDSPESLVVILGSKRRRRGWLEDLQAAARVVADWFA